MNPSTKIHSLPRERITPFQKRALTILAGNSGLSAERVLDILLMDALLVHFIGRTTEHSGSQGMLTAEIARDVTCPQDQDP